MLDETGCFMFDFFFLDVLDKFFTKYRHFTAF